MKMKSALLILSAFAPLVPLTVHANDFPTTDRVEYVLECMRNNGGKQEYIYKCSCAIDGIAKKYSYDEYVEASTAARYRTLGGERGAAFRDPEDLQKIAKKYKSVQDDVNKTCGVR